jgi:hypothetical protein
VAFAARGAVSVDALSPWGERVVGIALIAIGQWAQRLALSKRVHAHRHVHGDRTHVHVHVHARPHAAKPSIVATGTPHVHTHAALGVGVLHGCAGSSHLVGVLPALAFPAHAQAIVYLAGFAGGTIVAMACFGALIDWLGRRSVFASARAYRRLMALSASTAIGIGGFWLATG